jgi:hypothetical protein
MPCTTSHRDRGSGSSTTVLWSIINHHQDHHQNPYIASSITVLCSILNIHQDHHQNRHSASSTTVQWSIINRAATRKSDDSDDDPADVIHTTTENHFHHVTGGQGRPPCKLQVVMRNVRVVHGWMEDGYKPGR